MAGSSLYSGEYRSVFLRVFGSTPQLRLLDFFMDNPRNDFSRNEIMDAIEMAKRTLYEYLPGLVGEGAVKVSRKIGRAELYALNAESPVVRCFVRLEEELTRARETEYLYNELLRYIGEHPELATEYRNPPKQNRVDSITLSSAHTHRYSVKQ